MRIHLSKKIVLISSAAVLLIAAAVAWALSSNNGQVDASINNNPVRTATQQTFDSPYLSFRYMSTYKPHRLPATDDDLENYMLTGGLSYDKRLAVSVSKFNGTIATNSAYNLRNSQPAMYLNRTAEVDGSAATIWVKVDGLEQTVIVLRGNTIVVMSFTTAGAAENLGAEVDALLQSVRWKS